MCCFQNCRAEVFGYTCKVNRVGNGYNIITSFQIFHSKRTLLACKYVENVIFFSLSNVGRYVLLLLLL